jgi:hypothetical protein
MGAAGYSEVSVTTYQTTQRHEPNFHSHDNRTSHHKARDWEINGISVD